MNIGYLPWEHGESVMASSCLRDARNDLTYGEVGNRVCAFAEQLLERGLGPGDVVGIMLPNRVELLIGLLAAWRVGAAATPLNPAFTGNEAEYQLRDSGAGLILKEGPAAPTAGLAEIHIAQMRTEVRGSLPPGQVQLDDLALLIYTSGSTGRPKGVMLDHAHLRAMASMAVEHFRITDADHCLLVLPLFHVNAICLSFLTTMLCGGQLTILDRFSPEVLLAAVEQYRPTYFAAVPALYARLAELPADVDADTSSLRFAICGAAPVAQELLERCEQRFGFLMVEGYGLTEGTCASTCNPIDGMRKFGTVGPALPGQHVATMSPQGRILPTGEVGEVAVRGANVMRGYLHRPEETAATLVDGWLRTGDVGRIDEDGYLTLVDRVKDMIIRGGENLYPKEIESVLYGYPGVLEAAVVGAPDAVYGEVPVAHVVAYPDAIVTVEELLKHCRRNLTKVKIPVAIHLLGELPKNPVGKIDKPCLRETIQPR